ncbi:MAG: MFS transporter [Syntrophobacteraceae bacterium]|nr:MFS transporter [Syntrophobacteraceae bacterium]
MINQPPSGNEPGSSPGKGPPSFRGHLGPILFLTAIFFLNFIARIIPSPLMPAIEKDLQLDHGQAGSLFLLMASGYFISLMGSGFVSHYLHHRKTILLSSTALGMTFLLTCFSRDLQSLGTGLFLVGMASGLYLPSGIAAITSLVSPRHWGKALSIHELAPNLAFVCAPLFSELVLSRFSWRGMLGLVGGASMFLGLAFARFSHAGDFPGQAPSFRALKPLLKQPSLWIMVFLYGIGISGSQGIYSMLPLYLITDHGMSQGRANTLVALSRVTTPLLALVGGWCSDRFGLRRTMAVSLLLTGLSTIGLGLAPSCRIVPLIFLQANLSVCFFPAALAAISLLGPPSSRNVVISLIISLAFLLGAGGVPTLIGIMGTLGSFSPAISLVGVLSLPAAAMVHFLRLPSGKEVARS